MGEPYRTMAEIEKQFPNEWVLVDRLMKGRDNFAVGGVVVAHGPDRETVLVELDRIPAPVDVAFFYTGPITEDVASLA